MRLVSRQSSLLNRKRFLRHIFCDGADRSIFLRCYRQPNKGLPLGNPAYLVETDKCVIQFRDAIFCELDSMMLRHTDIHAPELARDIHTQRGDGVM